MLKQAESLENEVKTSEQEALQREQEEAAKQACIQQLEIAVKELQEQIQAANKGKPLHGLPENRKCSRDDDADSIQSASELVDAAAEQRTQPAKIPKKQLDMSTCFNAVDERITYVPGWHPIPRGSGLLITMPKSFKEKNLAK